MNETPRRFFPCGECPWRKDAAPRFTEEQFEQMASSCADRDTGYQPMPGEMWFACHKGQVAAPEEDTACAGWLAMEGHAHVGVRVAVASGRLPSDALAPGEGWPDLFESFAEMRRHQALPGPAPSTAGSADG
ncbi:DUF6283 family protein [Nocardiopsis sp. NPDC006139]|uniref:DUF6283 family protein n=1 Tax=Nocardiopsis sp. NPDC006139 TaxID=3154578 RepID=UPI0033A48CF6